MQCLNCAYELLKILFINIQQKDTVLSQLAEKGKMVSETFNAMEGITCNAVQGAMYAFPNIDLPKRAIEAAKVL